MIYKYFLKFISDFISMSIIKNLNFKKENINY